MLCRELLVQWFPLLLASLSAQPTAAELAYHVQDLSPYCLMRHLMQKQIHKERIGVSQRPLHEACVELAVTQISLLNDSPADQYFTIAKTMFGVLCAWMAPPGHLHARKNKPLQELLTFYGVVNGLPHFWRNRDLAHLRVLTRAIPLFLQQWYLEKSLSDAHKAQLAQYLSQTLDAIYNNTVFDTCFAILARRRYAYIGRAEACRKYSRNVPIGGFTQRFVDHLTRVLFLPPGAEYRYRIWSERPIEELGILPCAFGATDFINKFEVAAIRGVRTQTQLAGLRSGPAAIHLERVRFCPRFRAPLEHHRAYALNLHERALPDNPHSSTDLWSLRNWFSSFSFCDRGSRSKFFHFVNNVPMAYVYTLVLKMAAEKFTIPFHIIFSLPNPRLWILKFWEVANTLVSSHHKRRVVQKVEYWIAHWCHLNTYVYKFEYRGEPGEPSRKAIRGLLRGLFFSIMHPAYEGWFKYVLRKARFIKKSHRTYAERYTNATSHARRSTLAEYNRLSGSGRDKARSWHTLQIHKQNWSCYWVPGLETRVTDLHSQVQGWVAHLQFPIFPFRVENKVLALFDGVTTSQPRLDFGSRYRAYVEPFEDFARDQYT